MTLLCLAPLCAGALTLEQARSIAVERYPLMREYNLIALTEQYTIDNAAKAWLPQVSAGAQVSWQSAVAAYPDALKEMLASRGVDVKGISHLQYGISVDVQQSIWDGGRVRAAQDITRAESAEQAAGIDVELYELRHRIDEIYFSILLLGEQQQAVTSAIGLLQANLEKVNSLLRNGAAMQSDADAVEVELLTTRQQLLSIESAIAMYRAILGIYLGTDGNEPLDMPDDILPPPDNNAAARPESRLFDARLATIDARSAALDTSLLPRVGAFAKGAFGYPGLNFMEAMTSWAPRPSAIIGVSLTWEITPYYTKKNKLANLDIARQRIETARMAFDYNIDIQATVQRREIDRLRRISESDAEIIALRARVRQASEARLREGIIEPTDLLLRINEEKNAVIAANSHRIEYLKALYSLMTTLNK